MRPLKRQRSKQKAKRDRGPDRDGRERHCDRTATALYPGERPNDHIPPDLSRYVTSEKQSMQFADDLYRPSRIAGSATYNVPERNPASRFLVETTGTEITRLMDLPVEDRRPGNRAHVLAHRMIVKLVGLGFDVPACDVYSDSDKAIRLLWSRGERNVELVFPSAESESPYLYRSDERDYHVEQDPTPECILRWLHWALGNLSTGGIRAA